MNRNNLILAEEWFKKGDEDMKYAILGLKNNGPYSLGCFHCHQAVEKYLKGYLVYKEREFEKIHDLLLLLRLCLEIDKEFSNFIELCERLNAYYIPTRYPVPEIKEYTQEELRDFITRTQKIIIFVKERVKEK